MNARFLHTFCTVADLGGLNAAARRLGLSNTSISEQIRALEKEVNAKLIARSGRSITLTEAGYAILPVAREVVKRVNEIKDMAQLDRPKGMLRVGVAASAMITILPPALRHMAERYPEIELKIYPGSSPHLYRQLEADEVDCIITGLPNFPLPKKMTCSLIREEPMVLLCPGSLVDDDIDHILATCPFIRIDRNSWFGQTVTRFLESRGIRTRDLFEMDAQATVVMLVAQGLGVTLLPDWGMMASAGSRIRRLPVGDPAYNRKVGLIGLRTARARLTGILAEAFLAGSREGLSSALFPDVATTR
jgi:DNA-binding transcriptional LysR family regulator